MKLVAPMLDAFRGQRRKPTVILLISSPLLLTWKYFGTSNFWAANVFTQAAPETASMAGAMCQFTSCLLLLGGLPALIVKGVFGERLSDYGLGPGVPARTLGTFLILGPVFVLAGYLASTNATLRHAFPINPLAGRSVSMFALHALTYSAFYLGWEFYFRGFMLFGLRESVGDANAVLIQTLASSLLHIGNPALETFGAILGGLLWGLLALRTRSLFSGLGQHFLLGISLDAFLCFA